MGDGMSRAFHEMLNHIADSIDDNDYTAMEFAGDPSAYYDSRILKNWIRNYVICYAIEHNVINKFLEW